MNIARHHDSGALSFPATILEDRAQDPIAIFIPINQSDSTTTTTYDAGSTGKTLMSHSQRAIKLILLRVSDRRTTDIFSGFYNLPRQ
ncbi:MAG: hypothetical protein AAF722_02470 [Cyanobacteria bacterium P01_C01_bin.70]